ncbi:MAG: hypothetical protein LBV54_07445 [Puniceicoccales bacterium]|jgi:lipoprotein NlpI|nr:hypothetical protein [Puniceicoccales bacterium]
MKAQLVLLTLSVTLIVPGSSFADSPAAPKLTQDAPQKSTPRERATARFKEDAKIFSAEQRQEIERLYQAANRQLKTPEARENLKQLVKKYPKSNRAGCAVQYLGQISSGKEREAYLKTAIKEHADCYYGSGVQVGAYARFYLADYYRKNGKAQEAEALYKEIRENFSDAVNHKGKLLRDILPK